MKKQDSKTLFIYIVISLLSVAFLILFFSSLKPSALLSAPLEGGGNSECLEWSVNCIISAHALSDTFDTPTGDADAMVNALAKCEAAKKNIGRSMQGCVDGYQSSCIGPCQLSSKELENTVDQTACEIKYCTHVLPPPGPTEDDLKEYCSYTYVDGKLELTSCIKIHPRNRAGFPIGWSCEAEDGMLKHMVECKLP